MRKFIVPLHCGRFVLHCPFVLGNFLFLLLFASMSFSLLHTQPCSHFDIMLQPILNGWMHIYTTLLIASCSFHSAFLMTRNLNSRISNICASVVDIRPIIYQMSLRYLVSNSSTPYSIWWHIIITCTHSYIYIKHMCAFSISSFAFRLEFYIQILLQKMPAATVFNSCSIFIVVIFCLLILTYHIFTNSSAWREYEESGFNF